MANVLPLLFFGHHFLVPPVVKLNPFLRFKPSASEAETWIIENYQTKKTFAVSRILVDLLSALHFDEYDALVGSFSREGLNADNVSALTADFINKRILVDEASFNTLTLEYRSIEEIFSESASEWQWALEYHFATRDFAFLDYSPAGEGKDETRNRMLSYAEAEPDTKRFKTFPSSFERLPLSPPSTAEHFLCQLRLGSSEVADEEDHFKILCAIASVAFGATAWVDCEWSSTPLMRRSAPSGGSRHPCEGYLLERVEGDWRSWHVQSDLPALANISSLRDVRRLSSKLEDVLSKYQAVFLITCLFERNMYRYRESRTFRSVHMDAGHLMANLEVLSLEQGASIGAIPGNYFLDYLLNLGINPLEEGPMCALGLELNK